MGVHMNEIVSLPITGAEPPGLDSPYSALVNFYRAFNGRDLAAMKENWEHAGECVMSNPLGGIKRGWEEIGAVYGKIFLGEASIYVEFYDYTIHESGDVFHAVGRERGHLHKRGEEMALEIRTSRIFHRARGQWKQAHHHGSMESPALLARYQALVMQKNESNLSQELS
jgi:ketosteroid isomerase-like protein